MEESQLQKFANALKKAQSGEIDLRNFSEFMKAAGIDESLSKNTSLFTKSYSDLGKFSIDDWEKEIETLMSNSTKNGGDDALTVEATNPVTFLKACALLAKDNNDNDLSENILKWSKNWVHNHLIYVMPGKSNYAKQLNLLTSQLTLFFPKNSTPYSDKIQLLISKMKV